MGLGSFEGRLGDGYGLSLPHQISNNYGVACGGAYVKGIDHKMVCDEEGQRTRPAPFRNVPKALQVLHMSATRIFL